MNKKTLLLLVLSIYSSSYCFSYNQRNFTPVKTNKTDYSPSYRTVVVTCCICGGILYASYVLAQYITTYSLDDTNELLATTQNFIKKTKSTYTKEYEAYENNTPAYELPSIVENSILENAGEYPYRTYVQTIETACNTCKNFKTKIARAKQSLSKLRTQKMENVQHFDSTQDTIKTYELKISELENLELSLESLETFLAKISKVAVSLQGYQMDRIYYRLNNH
jgi:hypothetical protein